MKLRILFFILLTASLPVRAQSGWSWQNPLPQGNTLNAIQKAGSSRFFAVGKFGAIIRSDDAGLTWQALASGVTTELHALAFFNADTGLAAGAMGTILRTRDGGESWQKLTAPDTTTYYALFGFDYNTILAAGRGGAIIQSYNGGDSWETRVSNTTQTLYTIASNGIDYTYAAGHTGALVRSLDGGSTWSSWSWAAGGSTTIRAMLFPGNSIGLALGDFGRVYRSQNNGDVWSLQSSLINSPSLSAGYFTDPSNGFICGSGGALFSTDNAGVTWKSLVSGTGLKLQGIALTSGGRGVLCGESGTLLSTANSGLTWASCLDAFTTGKLRGIALADENVAVAVGDSSGKGMIFRTGDGGTSWSVRLRRIGVLLEDCCFISPDSGFVVGASSVVLRTIDGGSTWSQIAGLPVSSSFNGVHFVTPRIGAIVGGGGAIMRTNDAGATWTNQTNAAYGLPLQDVHLATPTTGLAAGYLGTILRTIDGGKSWSKISAGTTETLNGVAFADSNHAVIVGAKAKILRTTDRGANWSPVNVAGLPPNTTLEQIFFASPQVGFIVGSGGCILRTEDGGASWRLLGSPTSNNLNAVCFLDLHTGAAVGDNGTVLRTSDGGLPVELTAFSGRYRAVDGTVHLAWRTVTESRNYGFWLERRRDAQWDPVVFIAGHGTTAEEQRYNYIDRPGTAGGVLHYRLRQMDLDGKSRLLMSIRVEVTAVVRELALHANYPNPFNASTTLSFHLPQAGRVRLALYDASGRERVLLLDEHMGAGQHSVPWHAGSAASGIYVARLSSAGQEAVRKLLLLR